MELVIDDLLLESFLTSIRFLKVDSIWSIFNLASFMFLLELYLGVSESSDNYFLLNFRAAPNFSSFCATRERLENFWVLINLRENEFSSFFLGDDLSYTLLGVAFNFSGL